MDSGHHSELTAFSCTFTSPPFIVPQTETCGIGDGMTTVVLQTSCLLFVRAQLITALISWSVAQQAAASITAIISQQHDCMPMSADVIVSASMNLIPEVVKYDLPDL